MRSFGPTLPPPTTPPPDDGSWTDFLNPSEWVEKAGESILERIAYGLGDAAEQVMNGVWWALSGSTSPQVDSAFLSEWLSRTVAISLPLMVIFMVLQCALTAVRNRGAAGLGRVVIGGVAGVVGTYLLLPIVGTLVGFFDLVALGLAEETSGDVGTMVDRVTGYLLGMGLSAQGPLGGRLASMGAIVVGLFVVIAAIAVWLALLIRMMLVYVVLVVAPFMIAGAVWEPTRSWIRRGATLMVALIFTKLGVVLVFGLGASMIAELDFAGDPALVALGQLFGGLILLLLAALVPVACFRFFSFVGETAASALHDGGQAATGKVSAAVRRTASPANLMRLNHLSAMASTAMPGASARRGPRPGSHAGPPRPGAPATSPPQLGSAGAADTAIPAAASTSARASAPSSATAAPVGVGPHPQLIPSRSTDGGANE